MKKIVYLSLLFLISYACGPDVPGELRGVQGRNNFYPEEAFGATKIPYGMAYIPSGAFQTGDNDEDIMGMHTTQNKTFSVPAFYMDETEISNNEYRQFVYWVRDSIAREKLYRRQEGEDSKKWVNVPDNFFSEKYRTFMDKGSDVQGGNTPFEPFLDDAGNEKLDKEYIGLFPKADAEKKAANAKKEAKAGKENTPITIEDFELAGIFDNYDKSSKKSNKKPKKPKKNAVKSGRVENRKYFTLNWVTELDYNDPETSLLLTDMYYGEAEQYYKRKEIDIRLLNYEYYWIDLKEAAKRGKISNSGSVEDNYTNLSREPLGKDDKNNIGHRSVLDENGNIWVDATKNVNNKEEEDGEEDGEEYGEDGEEDGEDPSSSYTSTVFKNPGQDLDLGFTNSKGQHNAIRGHTDRRRFIIKEKINVYPDTLCWIRDNTFSNGEHMAKSYFYSNAYDNYPVVGVTWPQAKAFSVWRTQIFNTWLQSNGDMFVNDFRLPTESEWERAARGDMDMMEYPWGGPYIRNSAGCFQANFKPMRGRYFEDGGMTTVKVYSYNPNLFGLYCMAGNVAEWCSSAFNESSYYFQHDMSAEYEYNAKSEDAIIKKRKVIRGGSWKDIGYYLLNTTRTYEYQDSAKNYIGFRNVMSFLGRGGKDIDKENGEEIQSDIQLK